MFNKIKKIITKNDRLYILAKCIKNSNNPDMIKLIRGFYSQPSNNLTLILNSSSKLAPKSVYYIDLGVEDYRKTGFCALLRYTVEALCFAESLGFSPFVMWGKGTVYYENELSSYTDNVFLYYFESVSSVRQIINEQYVSWKLDDIEFYIQKKWSPYCIDDEELFLCAASYKKHIHLNSQAANYIDQSIKSIIKNNKVLGVHARGTDFNVGYINHPKAITSNIYISKAKELFNTGNYDKIFIATEDVNLLNSFIDAFGEELVYYDDVFRTSGMALPHGTQSNRPLHHYKLGLEVLRDIYTLAHCEGLVCGLSQVSFAARYVNIALDRKFKEVIILDHGING